jgi:hypothetical protein
MMSGFKNSLRNTLLHADAIVMASKHLARLFQDSDVILTVRFQYSTVIEDHRPLTFVPLENLFFQGRSLVYTVIRNVWNRANIVKVCLRIEVMWVPGFGGGGAEGNR